MFTLHVYLEVEERCLVHFLFQSQLKYIDILNPALFTIPFLLVVLLVGCFLARYCQQLAGIS